MNARRQSVHPPGREGSVLIIVAGILAALSLMAITFSVIARVEMRCAQNAHDRQLALAAARAGVGIAIEMLAQDDTLSDDWRDPWYTPQYNDPAIPRPKPTQFGSHRCITIAEGTLRGVSEIGSGINEDGPGDMNDDDYPGIRGVDDDGDGLVDEDSAGRQPGDPGYSNDMSADDDEDGKLNEDGPGDANEDGAPGVANEDDDGDGLIDECGYLNHDDDGDGLLDEDAPGDTLNGPAGVQLSEDMYGEKGCSNRWSEDYPALSFQRNNDYWSSGGDSATQLQRFVDYMKTKKPDTDEDGLVMDTMWYNAFPADTHEWYGGRSQIYVFADGDDAPGQRRVDENGDGCADGWSSNADYSAPWTYYVGDSGQDPRRADWRRRSTGAFFAADEDRLDNYGNERINVSGWEPEGYGNYCRFRSFAGGIYGMNAEDDDEDSDNLTREEASNVQRKWGTNAYWWKIGRPAGFIRDESSKINLNVHGSLYDPALFFDPDVLRSLSRTSSGGPDLGIENRYVGYAQPTPMLTSPLAGSAPYHDAVDAASGGLMTWNSADAITRKDVYGWAYDGRMCNQGFSVSFVRFFRAYGFTVRQAQNYALAIVRYRYGDDGRPGIAGVDDDFDFMRPTDTVALPKGDCMWDGQDNDGDWRGWRQGWNSAASRPYQDQGVDPRYTRGLFAGTTMLGSQMSVFWPGRMDNCPTFFRITGCPRIDSNEKNGSLTGYSAQITAQEGYRTFMCSCGKWISSYQDTQTAVICPFCGANVSVPGDAKFHPAVDELGEGIDEDDEYDPLYTPSVNPFGRYSLWRASNWTTGSTPQSSDDRRFGSIDQVISALLEKRHPQSGVTGSGATYECAVSYANYDNVDNDFDGARDEGASNSRDRSEEEAEARRVFNIVREDLSCEVADLDEGLINVNIDSWGNDGLDNDWNGRVDVSEDANEGAIASQSPVNLPVGAVPPKVSALAQAYYYSGINVAGATNVNQIFPASPIDPRLHLGVLANIVDFQDTDPFPSILYDPRNTSQPVYFGTEGVHLNEVMFGGERVGDATHGATTTITLQSQAGVGWSFDYSQTGDGWDTGTEGVFQLRPDHDAGGAVIPGNAGREVEATFQVNGLPPGGYVPVIYGDPSVNGTAGYPLKVYISGNTRLNVLTEFQTPTTQWDGDKRLVTIYSNLGTDEYGRGGSSTDGMGPWLTNLSTSVSTRLGAARITSSSFTVKVTARLPATDAAAKPKFSIRFVNWYLEFVNISRRPIKLIDRELNGDTSERLYLEVGDGATPGSTRGELSRFQLSGNGNNLTIPRGAATWCPPGREGTEGGSGEPAGKTKYIPGAVADGQFPPNYGYFVIALSEDAYDKTWGDSTVGTGSQGHWGDRPCENYPVYFLECRNTSSIAAGNPGIFMCGKNIFTSAATGYSANRGIRVFALDTSSTKRYLAGTWMDAFEETMGTTPSLYNVSLDFDLQSTLADAAKCPEYVSLEKTAPVVPIWKSFCSAKMSAVASGSPPFMDTYTGLVTFDEVWKACTENGTDPTTQQKLADRGSQNFARDSTTTACTRGLMNCTNSRWPYMIAANMTSRDQFVTQNALFIRDQMVAPMVLDGPLPSVGWLALVPAADWGQPDELEPDGSDVRPVHVNADGVRLAAHPWRNLTPRPQCMFFSMANRSINPNPFNARLNPLFTLLGFRVGNNVGRGCYPLSINAAAATKAGIDAEMGIVRMRTGLGNWRQLACVPGVRAKININTASRPVLLAAFGDAIAAKLVKYRPYRCVEDIMGIPAPDPDAMLEGRIESPAWPVRPTFYGSTTAYRARLATVYTGYVNPADADTTSKLGNFVTEQGINPRDGGGGRYPIPFFTRYAFETYSIDGDLANDIGGSNRNFPDWNKDHDDSGAGAMLDDVACDLSEQMEWYLRYGAIIDIKSRFFTIYSRGRVFGPTGLAADARVRAVVERADDSNEEGYTPLTEPTWYRGSTSFIIRAPNGRADGVSLRSLDVLDD